MIELRALTVAALIAAFRGRVFLTWALVLAETALTALLPLLIGLTIDGLLEGSSTELGRLAVVMGTLIGVAMLRRMYDTRVYGTMRVALGEAQTRAAPTLPVSALNARLGMGRELADFLEETVPDAMSAAVHLCIALVVLYSYSTTLALACVVTATAMALIYALFHRRFYRLNASLNQQTERQVSVLATRRERSAAVHLRRIRRLEVGISDTEAVLYGAVFVVLLSLVLFNLWFAATALTVSVGMLFAVVSYSWEFVESSLVLPVTFQSWSRLSELQRRIVSDEHGATNF
ncbi:MAG: ABC transporter six-transmembrane domain-containing protein [Pseudomonadota bacterium]